MFHRERLLVLVGASLNPSARIRACPMGPQVVTYGTGDTIVVNKPDFVFYFHSRRV